MRVEKNKAHRSIKQNQNNEAATKFKLLPNKFETCVKKAKREFYRQKFESCMGDSGQTYKLINDIKGTNRKSSQRSALNSCSERCTDPSSADFAETHSSPMLVRS